MAVISLSRTGPWPLPRVLITSALEALLEEEGAGEAEISLAFMDDAEIRALNRRYLRHDWPADVLAFALHGEGEPVAGDIYVGYEQARRQARELGIPLREELLRLAVHGTLHTLGYDHPEGEGREESDLYLRQEEIVARALRPREDH